MKNLKRLINQVADNLVYTPALPEEYRLIADRAVAVLETLTFKLECPSYTDTELNNDLKIIANDMYNLTNQED